MTTLTPDELARAIDDALAGIEGIRAVPKTGAVVLAAGRGLLGLGDGEPAPASKVTVRGDGFSAEVNIAVTGGRSAANAADLAGTAVAAVLERAGVASSPPEIVVRVVAVDTDAALSGGAHLTGPSGP